MSSQCHGSWAISLVCLQGCKEEATVFPAVVGTSQDACTAAAIGNCSCMVLAHLHVLPATEIVVLLISRAVTGLGIGDPRSIAQQILTCLPAQSCAVDTGTTGVVLVSVSRHIKEFAANPSWVEVDCNNWDLSPALCMAAHIVECTQLAIIRTRQHPRHVEVRAALEASGLLQAPKVAHTHPVPGKYLGGFPCHDLWCSVP